MGSGQVTRLDETPVEAAAASGQLPALAVTGSAGTAGRSIDEAAAATIAGFDDDSTTSIVNSGAGGIWLSRCAIDSSVRPSRASKRVAASRAATHDGRRSRRK